MTLRQRRALTVAVGLVVVGALAWSLRWVVGGRAIEIVDPVVRRWAAAEVARLSDGSYRLEVSPLRVDAAEQRITIDTITLDTDPERNAARAAPLPTVQLRLHHCVVEGIALDQLARRRGFAAERAGCDSVQVVAFVPEDVARDTAGSGGFLSLSQDLDLGRGIPFLQVDSLLFPHVRTALSIAAGSGRGTTLAFDRLGVRLEAFRYDPDEPATRRRPLLSRNVTVSLDSLRGNRESTDRTELDRLRADLASGTVLLTGLRWRPASDALADSLGIVALDVDSLDVAGVDWRAFLTRGDVLVRRIALVEADLALRALREPPAAAAGERPPPRAPTWTLAATLQTFGRRLRLDTLDARALVLRQLGPRDTLRTVVERVALHDFRSDPAALALAADEPIGPARVVLTGVTRASREATLTAASVAVDLPAGTIALDSVRYAPEGSDADFVRRQRSRRDRIALGLGSLRLDGLDAEGWVRHGGYRAGLLVVRDLDLDILSDKRLPPGRPSRHRTPQGWAREVAPRLAIDSVEVHGRLQYRERGAEAPRAGVLRFESLEAHVGNLTSTGSAATRFAMRAALMGRAPITLEGTLPLGDSSFTMRYRGDLGSMAAEALNPFLDGAIGARFTDGTIHGVRFEATVTGGMARGEVVPRYEGLWIALPGAARSGFLSGLRRAVAKFAANQFVVREDNVAGGPDTPRNGAIRHRWTPRETLIQFLWNGVRDGLLTVVKR